MKENRVVVACRQELRHRSNDGINNNDLPMRPISRRRRTYKLLRKYHKDCHDYHERENDNQWSIVLVFAWQASSNPHSISEFAGLAFRSGAMRPWQTSPTVSAGCAIFATHCKIISIRGPVHSPVTCLDNNTTVESDSRCPSNRVGGTRVLCTV